MYSEAAVAHPKRFRANAPRSDLRTEAPPLVSENRGAPAPARSSKGVTCSVKRKDVNVRAKTQERRAAQAGMTLPEVMLAVALAAIVLAAGVVSVGRYMSQRTLLGWSDIVVNDIRAAQHLSMARRAAVTVTFAAKSGQTPASYAITVGSGTLRNQTLPMELNLTAQTIQFSTLGLPTSGSAVTVQITDSVIGASRTISVAPVTGTVTAQ